MWFFENIFANIISGLVLIFLGYLFGRAATTMKKIIENRGVKKFFGLKGGNIVICHTALISEPSGRRDIPWGDIQTAYNLMRLIEDSIYVDQKNIVVMPYLEYLTDNGNIKAKYKDHDLILIGGPKHNKCTELILDKAHNLRYSMKIDHNSDEHYIYNSLTGNTIRSQIDVEEYKGTDFGLIISMDNPINPEHSVCMLMGIHGAGTVGAEKLISSSNTLRQLCNSRSDGIIQRVVVAECSGDYLSVNYAFLE